MAKYIETKAPNARKTEKFIVYPFVSGETIFKLQSDHRYMIIDLKKNTLSYSKRIANYPNSLHCAESFGGQTIELPTNLKDAINNLTPDQSHCVPLGAKSSITTIGAL